MKKRMFLLGGHDLEMQETRRLLVMHGECFADANLSWSNARLSAYMSAIAEDPNSEYYGIELQEDMLLPKYYHRIDHHNDYNQRPAAILQVAEILGIKPDRYLQLVAANDAGYIPAMEALGATKTEITTIRKQDRAAQGVTEEDEHLAELSISGHLERYEGLFIVHAQTSKFSPICDRLFPYQRLLIYTDDEWTYYGEDKSDLIVMLTDDINNNKVYHGGGDNGYIGAARGSFTPQQILDFVTLIKQRYERN